MTDEPEDKHPHWQGWNDPPLPTVSQQILAFLLVFFAAAILVTVLFFTAAVWWTICPIGALGLLWLTCS